MKVEATARALGIRDYAAGTARRSNLHHSLASWIGGISHRDDLS